MLGPSLQQSFDGFNDVDSSACWEEESESGCFTNQIPDYPLHLQDGGLPGEDIVGLMRELEGEVWAGSEGGE